MINEKKMISNLMFKFALIVRCNYSVPIGKILMFNFFSLFVNLFFCLEMHVFRFMLCRSQCELFSIGKIDPID